MPKIIECPKCGKDMFKTIYGWYKCTNEFCFHVENATLKKQTKWTGE